MMDEMKIGTKIMRGMVSKIITKVLKMKLGYNVGIQLNEFDAKVNDGKAHVHLNIDAEMTQEELNKILETIGL